jgi:hypothetical protein
LIKQWISAFGDSRNHVRASAALVLGEIGPHAQEAIPVLQAAVARSNAFDVMIAGSALEKIQRTRVENR